MIPESVTIILPLPAKVLSPNYTVGSIGGRFMKAAAIKKQRRQTRDAVLECRVENAPWAKVSVMATFFHKNKQKHDDDNAIGSLKAVYDGIVDAGLVLDDDWKHMSRMRPIFRLDHIFPRVSLTIMRDE